MSGLRKAAGGEKKNTLVRWRELERRERHAARLPEEEKGRERGQKPNTTLRVEFAPARGNYLSQAFEEYCSTLRVVLGPTAHSKKHLFDFQKVKIKAMNTVGKKRTWERRMDDAKVKHRPKLKDWSNDR